MKVIMKFSVLMTCLLFASLRAGEPKETSLVSLSPDPDSAVKAEMVRKVAEREERRKKAAEEREQNARKALAQPELANAMRTFNLGDVSTIRTRPIIELLVQYGAAVRAQPAARELVTFDNNILYTFERDAHVAQALARINQEAATGVVEERPCNFCKFAESATPEDDDEHGIVASFQCDGGSVKVLLNLFSYTIANLVILTNFHRNYEPKDCSLEDIQDPEVRNLFMKAHALGVRVLRKLGIFDTIDVGFNLVSEVAGGSIGDHLHGHAIGHIRGEHTLEAAEVAAAINAVRKYPDIQHLLRDIFKEVLAADSLNARVTTPSTNLYSDRNPECALCQNHRYVLKTGKHWQVVVSVHPCKTGTLDIISLHDGLWFDELSNEAICELYGLMAACTNPLKTGLGIHGFNICVTSGKLFLPKGAPAHSRLHVRFVARKRADTCQMTECEGLRIITQRPSTTHQILKPLFDEKGKEPLDDNPVDNLSPSRKS